MRRFLALALLSLFSIPAQAEVPLDGWLIARDECPAFQSFNNQTNPGSVMTMPGRAYEITAANKADATHYLVIVPGVDPERRWVAVGCGQRTVDVNGNGTATSDNQSTPDQPTPTGDRTQYILAVSWQPAFCETRPDKPECESQTEDRFDASHFTLHGLWPQPRNNAYCNVSAADRSADEASRWTDLPEVELSAALRADLDEVMPGTQSSLERHEWTKHGTCYGTNAEEYFADSLVLMETLNTSAVADLFADNVGNTITLDAIRAAFDDAFGPGAGERIRVACSNDGNRRLIGEITIGLTGDISALEDLPTLLAAARSTDGGCTDGVVDPVGQQ